MKINYRKILDLKDKIRTGLMILEFDIKLIDGYLIEYDRLCSIERKIIPVSIEDLIAANIFKN